MAIQNPGCVAPWPSSSWPEEVVNEALTRGSEASKLPSYSIVMMKDHYSRRTFLQGTAVVAGMATSGLFSINAASGNSSLHLSTNGYPWMTFYQRAGRDYNAALDTVLGEVAASGLDGFESSAGGPADLESLIPLLKKHDLEMRSLYVNSTLHDPDQADESINNVLRIAEKARTIGTRIIVTNPNPIRWGGPENKDDSQLRFQAGALDRLGGSLKSMEMELAYHFHDIELRQAARELHHMMIGTDPDMVSLCLDAHWVYRGAGNSEVAVFDIATLYAQRIREIHVRQSRDDIWTETLGPGDIDYTRLVQILSTAGVHPLVVLEQAVENGSPNTMDAETAHAKSVAYARRIFAPLAT